MSQAQPFFDTYKYAKILMSHSFSEAEVIGLMSAEIFTLQATLDRIATQEDLRRVEFVLRADLSKFEARVAAHIQRLDDKIDALELRLDAKIDKNQSEMKHFVLKNTITMILTVISMNIALFTLISN